MARTLLQRKLEEIVVLTRESTNADGVAVALRENGHFYCRASQGFAPEPGVIVEPGFQPLVIDAIVVPGRTAVFRGTLNELAR